MSEEVVYAVSPSELRPMFEVQTFEPGHIIGSPKRWLRGERYLSEKSAKANAEDVSLQRQVETRVVRYE